MQSIFDLIGLFCYMQIKITRWRLGYTEYQISQTKSQFAILGILVKEALQLWVDIIIFWPIFLIQFASPYFSWKVTLYLLRHYPLPL